MCFNRLSDVWKIEIRGRGSRALIMFCSNTLSFSIGFMKELVAIVLQKIISRKKKKERIPIKCVLIKE